MRPDERRVRQMFALLRHAGVADRQDRLQLMSAVLSKPVTSTNDMNEIEVQAVVDTLDYWKRSGDIVERCAGMLAGEPEPEPEPLRTHDVRGHPLVRVQFEPGGTEFTYAWCGQGDLEVGDEVIVQSRSSYLPGVTGDSYSVVTVSGLGSNYAGTLTAITKRWKDHQSE